MRPDMQNVIIERPRVGGHGYREPMEPDYRKALDEDSKLSFPVKEGMSKKYGYQRKEQTDVLGPLYGFLKKNVGRPWDKVWSEICEHAKGFMGQHLKTHVTQMVEVNCTIVDGELRNAQGFRLSGGRYWDAFYVHPKSGILTLVPKNNLYRSYRRSEPKSLIVRLEGQDYYKHNGIWYRVTTEKFEPAARSPYEIPRTFLPSRPFFRTMDVFGNDGLWISGHSLSWHLVKVYGASVYCTSKQQANKKECRKLNQLSP